MSHDDGDQDDDGQVRVWAARAVLSATDLDARSEVLREVFESDCCIGCFVQAVLDCAVTITDAEATAAPPEPPLTPA